jgi:tartrate/fumarate subfamily iron-sulfur-dependent hydro-lyase beta chain
MNTDEDFTKLKLGEKVLLNGTIFTARDKAHLFFLEEDFEKIRGGVLYHCGPIIKGDEVISAGPTTSERLSKYTPAVIEKYGIKAIIGKGGMNEDVLLALKGKAVYLAAVGGAGVIYAKSMKLKNVYKKEFGMAEAIWEFEVKDFPVIVAMDAFGNSLYDEVKSESELKMNELF